MDNQGVALYMGTRRWSCWWRVGVADGIRKRMGKGI